MKPTIALFTGDPAGIGPELVAQLLADGTAQQAADILLIGSRPVLDDGMRSAKVHVDLDFGAAVRAPARPRVVDWAHVNEGGFAVGTVGQKNGRVHA